MSVTISELRVEYAEYQKNEHKHFVDGGSPGSVLVGRRGLTIEPPCNWRVKREDRHAVYVKPEEIDGLIAALQQARELGRQIFNREDGGK